MSFHQIAEGVGYGASALGVAMVVPQIVRTYRHRDLPGVSAMSWALTAIACYTWLLYGVRTGELPQIPGNVLMVAGSVLLVLVVPSAFGVGSRGAALLAATAAITVGAFVLPSAVIGAVGFGIALISGLPQLAISLRRRPGASAVSVLTWVLRVASQAAWLFYAIAVGDAVVAVSATFLCGSAAVVVVAELLRRPAPAAVPAPALVH